MMRLLLGTLFFGNKYENDETAEILQMVYDRCNSLDKVEQKQKSADNCLQGCCLTVIGYHKCECSVSGFLSLRAETVHCFALAGCLRTD